MRLHDIVRDAQSQTLPHSAFAAVSGLWVVEYPLDRTAVGNSIDHTWVKQCCRVAIIIFLAGGYLA